MNASPHIVPILIPYKDLLSVVAEIEKEIKGSNAQAGRSNEELLTDFLSGGDMLGPISTPKPPAELDNSDILTPGEGVAS